MVDLGIPDPEMIFFIFSIQIGATLIKYGASWDSGPGLDFSCIISLQIGASVLKYGGSWNFNPDMNFLHYFIPNRGFSAQITFWTYIQSNIITRSFIFFFWFTFNYYRFTKFLSLSPLLLVYLSLLLSPEVETRESPTYFLTF